MFIEPLAHKNVELLQERNVANLLLNIPLLTERSPT